MPRSNVIQLPSARAPRAGRSPRPASPITPTTVERLGKTRPIPSHELRAMFEPRTHRAVDLYSGIARNRPPEQKVAAWELAIMFLVMAFIGFALAAGRL